MVRTKSCNDSIIYVVPPIYSRMMSAIKKNASREACIRKLIVVTLTQKNMHSERQIMPGLSISSSGKIKLDATTRDVIVDLAIDLVKETNLPVTIDHVVAAIRLATRKNRLPPNKPIRSSNPALVGILKPHVKTVFSLWRQHRRGTAANDD